MNTFIYTCLVCMVCIGFTGAKYGDCVKYCGTDTVPVATDVMIACVEKNNCSYCIWASKGCPESLSCSQPVASPDGRCLVCPGEQCVYEGNSYRKGDSFESFDGVNECKCKKGGKVKCSDEELPIPSEFCF